MYFAAIVILFNVVYIESVVIFARKIIWNTMENTCSDFAWKIS